MKIAIIVSIILSSLIFANDNGPRNPELAKELNADQYGMSKYVMAFLKKVQIYQIAKRKQ